MYVVAKFDVLKEEAEFIFEAETHIECEIFVDSLENTDNIEILEKY